MGPFPKTMPADSEQTAPRIQENAVLRLALVFLLVALTAGLFGLTDVAVTANDVAKVFFFVFLVLFVVSVVFYRRIPPEVA